MASADKLRKLKLNDLKVLAIEQGIDPTGRKKQELVEELLNTQVTTSVLTPVRNQQTPVIFATPTCTKSVIADKENLPPFHKVIYLPHLPAVKVFFTMIYDFLITRATESGGHVNNFKGLDKAVKHHDAGDVKNISHAKINNTTIYVKALCLASMKKVNYQVYICFTKLNDDQHSIDYAYCQCPIGAAQACSHIGALLFALKDLQPTSQPAGASCTSVLLCTWKVPRGEAKPLPVSAFNKRNDDTTFDPRHSLDRRHNIDKTLSALQELKDIFPRTGMSHLWNIPDPVPDICMEQEIETSINPLYQQMMQMFYIEGNLPPPNIDMELVEYIEEYTRSQRLSNEWKKLHIGRVTSSLFGDVMSSGQRPSSLVKQIVEGSNLEKYTNLPAAVQWGVDSEGRARDQYMKTKKSIHKTFNIQLTGLTLCSSHAFLGTSSDGKVTEGESVGALEIKCPYSLKGTLINRKEIQEIMAMEDKTFCLQNTDSGPRLRHSHKYYAQVQGEMAIMGLPWCDFVVWTEAKSNNILIDRINFDETYITTMMPKLLKFYMEHIYPVYYK